MRLAPANRLESQQRGEDPTRCPAVMEGWPGAYRERGRQDWTATEGLPGQVRHGLALTRPTAEIPSHFRGRESRRRATAEFD